MVKVMPPYTDEPLYMLAKFHSKMTNKKDRQKVSSSVLKLARQHSLPPFKNDCQRK